MTPVDDDPPSYIGIYIADLGCSTTAATYTIEKLRHERDETDNNSWFYPVNARQTIIACED
jgi:hypothetical protein